MRKPIAFLIFGCVVAGAFSIASYSQQAPAEQTLAERASVEDVWSCATSHFLKAAPNPDDPSTENPVTAMVRSTRWRAGEYITEGEYRVLTVGFLEGEDWLHERVLELANLWSAVHYTNNRGAYVKFVEAEVGSEASANIRVKFSNMDSALLGRRARHRAGATMWLRSANRLNKDAALDALYARSVVIHEFGHALGLIHEQLHREFSLPSMNQ